MYPLYAHQVEKIISLNSEISLQIIYRTYTEFMHCFPPSQVSGYPCESQRKPFLEILHSKPPIPVKHPLRNEQTLNAFHV